MSEDHGAQATAEAAVRRMDAADAVAPSLGVKVLTVGPGHAEVAMTPTPAMVNGAGVLHGGYLFMLADIALAYAANSHGPVAVARSCEIEFLAPGVPGQDLRAAATERRRLPRGGIYDVAVTAADGTVLAELRGHCRHFVPPVSTS